MPIITDETVRSWRKELDRLRAEEIELNERITALERKLNAASELGFGEPDDLAAQAIEGDQEDADSLPSLICSFLAREGRAVKPPEMKRLLIEQGVPAARFGKNNGYYYTTLGRLVKRGKLSKRGKAYRITS